MRPRTLKRIAATALAMLTVMAACGNTTASTDSGTDSAGSESSGTDGQQVAQANGSRSNEDSSTREQLESFETVFADVAEEILPVVVEVNVVSMVEVPQSPFDFFFSPRGERDDQEQQEVPQEGLGSGVIVRQDGDTVYVITNNHVVSEADRLNVGLADGRQYEAELVGGDTRLDLALLEFTTSEDVPVATLDDSNELQVGNWVVAVGNPFGFESTVTAGIVSALGRTPAMAQAQQQGANVPTLTDFIQTDAAINPGNSGGALSNLDGEIVGINTWIASRSGGSVGIGFAIPANVARKAVNDFIEEGEIVYGWLGVSIADSSSSLFQDIRSELNLGDETGALVVNVYQGSPAAQQGLLPGDFVTSVNGESIDNSSELTRIIGNLSPNESMDIGLIRNGESRSFEIEISQREPEAELDQLSDRLWPGVIVAGINETMRDQLDVPGSVNGVVAVQIAEDSPAGKADIRQGDIIESVGGTSVDGLGDFYRLFNDSGRRIRLGIWRRGATTETTIRR
ncbi:MAG: Do family serine endopeptidase [Spirochaetota bacterium]